MRTELGNRMISRDTNALALRIILVCRPRTTLKTFPVAPFARPESGAGGGRQSRRRRLTKKQTPESWITEPCCPRPEIGFPIEL